MSDSDDYFGSTDPRLMPSHLFRDASHLDYQSAKRGNPQKQNFSVCPRYWYIDADFNCAKCRTEFTWTAGEQKVWFEDCFFWIDSCPRLCRKCMANRRYLESLRKEYDAIVPAARVGNATEPKRRVIEIVCELETAFGSLPEKMIETKTLFEREMRSGQQGRASNAP